MVKHNVVDLQSFIKDKQAVKFEQSCLSMLNSMGDKISEMKSYIDNFKRYIGNLVEYGHIKQSFADDLIQQVEIISIAATAHVKRREPK